MSGPQENVEPAELGPAAKAELDRAFEDFYRSHLRDVYSYAYYRVGNHHDAEDLTEQAFLQAYRHFDRARRESDGRPLRPWVIRIAHNLASNYYRDRSRRPQTALENADPIAARHDTEAIAEGREELRQVMANLEHLSEDRREALIMRFALGMDNREIARALGRSDGAVKRPSAATTYALAMRSITLLQSRRKCPGEASPDLALRPVPRGGMGTGAFGSHGRTETTSKRACSSAACRRGARATTRIGDSAMTSAAAAHASAAISHAPARPRDCCPSSRACTRAARSRRFAIASSG